MTPTEIHYTVSGKEIIKTVVTTDNCERRKSLQGDNCIDISFHDTEYIELPAGSYIIFENENIYLLFDDGDKLLIKNGKYSKERKKLFIGNKDISNSGWSMVLAAEVSATNTKSIF